MTLQTEPLTPELYEYLVGQGSTPDPVAEGLIRRTQELLPQRAHMQVAPEQARFLTLLTRLLGARDAVEVGTFTGLSALSIARGLPADGRLLCCDVSAEYTAVGREYWAQAGVADRIEVRLGPAAQTLRALEDGRQFDLAFLDADKTGYAEYWDLILPRMRPGGVVLADNVLRHGRVLDPVDEGDLAIVHFNEQVLADDRVESMMLPVADGLSLARVR